MRLQDIMTREVESVAPSLSAEDAWEIMAREDIRHLVVMEERQLVGILTERDLGGRKGAAARKNRLVVELMTPHAITARARTTVREAANLLRGHVIGCLPVVERGKVLGIVTTTDLLEILGRGGEPRRQTRERVLADRGPARDRVAREAQRERQGQRAVLESSRAARRKRGAP
jgi:acetoin utilization protein AcuB